MRVLRWSVRVLRPAVRVLRGPITVHSSPMNVVKWLVSVHCPTKSILNRPMRESFPPVSEHWAPVSEHWARVTEGWDRVTEGWATACEDRGPASEDWTPVSEHSPLARDHFHPLSGPLPTNTVLKSLVSIHFSMGRLCNPCAESLP